MVDNVQNAFQSTNLFGEGPEKEMSKKQSPEELRKAGKRFPAIGQVWRFDGTKMAPPCGDSIIVDLRWFYGRAEAVFDDGCSVAGLEHMMDNPAWKLVATSRPAQYREIFKAAYTAAVMAGATIPDGVFAGATAVRKAVGDDEMAHEVLRGLQARLGGVLGDAS